MSLLPGQIIPASMPIGKLSPDGKSVLIDENWWLFLYNIYLNSVNADVAGGFLKSFNGRTVSAAVPTTGDYKLSMLSDVSPDSWNDRDVLAYSSALAKWTASPQSEMTIVVETANGLSGTVVQADNEQQITLSTTASGVLKGVSDAIESAVSGVDFSPGTSALATGILKTTTGTGALSVAVAADFPILNQNTTGNAATVTTNANLTGPVTSVGNATSVTANAITNAMLAEMPTDTIKGNNTAATANAIDLTATQVTAMLDAYAGSAQGVVPAGSGGTTNYLREDGTWAVPSGSATWGSITGTLSNQTDLVDEFALYGALANGNNWSTAQYFTAPYQGPFIWFRETTSGPTTTSPYSYFANDGSSGYTVCNFEWYDGTNYFQGWRSNYNSGAPAFSTYKNTLDDGAGAATFSGDITAANFSGSSSGTNTGDQTITLTGDVTGSGTGSFATTVASAPWSALTGVPIYSGSAIGLVPAGSGGTTNFLREDGTWALPPNSGGSVTSVSVVDANGFTGTVATDTTTPAITLETTVTGMVKGNGTALEVAESGTDFSPGTSSLGTGIVKTTTGTGALTVAVPADFPILNQDTTGNAATVTTNADLTGPVTSTGNATAVTANAITNAMLAQSPAMTVKGNNTAATANAIDLTAAQVTAMLDAYSGSAQGLVPAGSGGTTNYLREDGAWAEPPTPGGSVTDVSIVSANGFAGTVADPNTTPAITLETTVTGILYGDGTAVTAATAADFPTLNQNTTGSSGSLSPGAEINGVNFTGTSAITVGAAWADVTGTPTTLAGYGITDALENPMTTAGDMIIGGTAGAPQRLAAGAAGTMLASVSGAPAWGNATELDYASGASVDSLMPAEAGADVTATHTSALASTLANQSATALKLNLVWNPDWDIYALAAGTNPPTVITEDGSTSAPSTSATFPAGAAGYASSRVELHNSPDFSIVSGQTYTAVSTIQLSRALVGGESVTVYVTGVYGGWETTIVQGDAGSDGSTVTLPPLSYTAAADGQDYFVIYATCTTALTVYSSNRQFFMTGGGQHAQSVTIPGASNAKAYVNFGDTTTGGHVGLGGAGTLLQSNGTSLQWTAAPTLSSITIDGGTVYQNTSGRWMNLYVGFSTVSTGTVQTFLGPTSSPSLTRSDDVVGNRTITLRVPPGWYYEFSGLATSGSSYALYEN